MDLELLVQSARVQSRWPWKRWSLTVEVLGPLSSDVSRGSKRNPPATKEHHTNIAALTARHYLRYQLRSSCELLPSLSSFCTSPCSTIAVVRSGAEFRYSSITFHQPRHASPRLSTHFFLLHLASSTANTNLSGETSLNSTFSFHILQYTSAGCA